MILPNFPQGGSKLSAFFAQLRDWLLANRITSVVGGRLKSNGTSGKTLVIDEKRGEAGGSSSCSSRWG
tara:strand:+ start:187 stop:390 length:204 start_codon:yes stop_codon:yes gene_type:complete